MGFFKTMLASMLGMIVAGVILIFLFVMMISLAFQSSLENLASKGDKQYVVKEHSVLHLKLENPIVDNGPIENLNFGGDGFDKDRTDGLNCITESIRRAAGDKKIKGIFLETQVMQCGMATLEEIRNALLDFKKSGKFIYAYGEYFDTKSYYLATTADKIACFPDGLPAFVGMSAQPYFIKGMLDKMEIEMAIIRGSNNKFKSAVEPFMYDKMSDANRQQVSRILEVLWGRIRNGVAVTRGVDESALTAMADSMKISSAQAALSNKLIDEVMYKDEFMKMLEKKAGWKGRKKGKLVSLGQYIRDSRESNGTRGGTAAALKRKAESKQDQVAVIYATGDIIDGKGSREVIGSVTLAAQIKKARLNKHVKAIVLRVNSPGGSALASEVIWRETQLARKVKPVVVSMGDLAASGGYYISCGADRIYAQPNTITGSIGVFGVLPNTEKFFKNKLGITFDRVKTNAHADLGSITRGLTDEEYRIIQKSVDRIYDTFTGRVSEGRKLDQQVVKDSIGQGRVWMGSDALSLGLVDSLGGLQDAIRFAVHKAKIKKYVVREYPRILSPFEEIMRSLSGKDEEDNDEEVSETSAMLKNVQVLYPNVPKSMIKSLENTARMLQRKGIYTYYPWLTDLH